MEGNTMGPRQKLALLVVAGAHLGLVAAAALKMPLRGRGWSRPVIAGYEAISGTDSFQTFFDGGATPSLRPIFEVTDRSGRVTTDALNRTVNLEVDLRVDGLISCFSYDDEDFRRTLAASWAGAMFDRHPGAERVVVRVDESKLPSMEEHREGQRPGWHTLYRATFSPQTAARSTGDTEAGRR